MSNKTDAEITTLAGNISGTVEGLSQNEIGIYGDPPENLPPEKWVHPITGKPVPEPRNQNTKRKKPVKKNARRETNRRKQRLLATIGALITACTIYIAKHNNTPIDNENINETIANTSIFDAQLRLLSDFAIQKGILKQEEGLFKQPKLNIPIEDFIELANINSNDHIKIYLWDRLGVPVHDILKELSLRNTNMYYDSAQIVNTYYASVIKHFKGTIDSETPLGIQYSNLMEKIINEMSKDEKSNLITNYILDYIIEQESTFNKGGNYGR